MAYFKILVLTSVLALDNIAIAERDSSTTAQVLRAAWSSWSHDIKPKTDKAWPELRKIDARFKIEARPQLNLQKGGSLVFTLSPAGMSLRSTF
ncbi:Uncharacterised protein [Zhongshania aliphaticivorans]|uniref:Uncharacterized protein n=1 Tax=Zhongshania aliphaticivorans TaxID=1470434 RepID=A0A5S9QBU1_9GAMM|nr:hypothetical protein [Zhongshania aliphaticivorans]CAA0087414.1 Uncharacterised protein [Zhongshania aliphaticivorans]CAA0114808.1 Uncharacterised protein [Zhongshania aliphaticivorans]